MPRISGESGATYDVEDTPITSDGGQSQLFRCRDTARVTRVYKRYHKPLTDLAAIGWVSEAARRGREVVPAAEAAAGLASTAESSINWPIDVVRQGNSVIGVVLPLIPPQFFLPDGRPRSAEFLFMVRDNPPAARIRVGVLIRLCDLFVVLQDQQLVHGDISPKNVVWTESGPHTYLIDCDSIHPARSTAHRGVATPNWQDPRLDTGIIQAHDQYSDRYGLALLMYRGLFRNPGAPALIGGKLSQATGIPTGTDPRLRALFDRSFSDAAATDTRPTATEWRTALTTAFLTADGSAYRASALDMLDRHAERVAPTRHARVNHATTRIPHAPDTTRIPAASATTTLTATSSTTTLSGPQSQAPPSWYRPQGPATTASLRRPRPPLPPPSYQHRRNRTGWLVAGIIVALIIAAIATNKHDRPTSNTVPDTTSTAPRTTPAAPDPAASARQARAVSALLDRSHASRLTTAAAIPAILACRNVAHEAAELADTETARQSEYSDASQLDLSALPSGTKLKTDLIEALTTSYLADDAYARWAANIANSCDSTAPQTADYRTGNNYSGQATKAKLAFLTAWNPIALAHNLPTRAEEDI
ncbi:hypothetical protein ACFXHA_04170 [Nocardia sp. NPDC059240]|uniref:hypothetical protein n=1 Tax=Nocardia sp. NPDC059240 TaxID=3346786 RepID=UPI00367BBE38